MPVRYGALSEEWAHLDLVCGLTADLLPVVSNPNAIISPLSKMKAAGKTPSIYNRNQHVAGIPDWTSYQATGGDIEKWSGEEDYGICLQTREVRAIDIDIEDVQRAAEVRRVIEGFIQSLPRRSRSESGKCLLAFRIGKSLPKKILRTEHGIIEFLATGQQFIAYGTHPSGVRYEWDWNGHTDFPEITLEQFNLLWEALAAEFAISEATGGLLRNSKDVPNLGTIDPIVGALPVLAWGRGGEAYIECPWIEGHSMDSGVTQTCYFPAGTRGYEQGHFSCLHASCAHRTDADFLDAYGLRAAEFEVIAPEVEKRVFNIKLKGGALPEEIALAEEALLEAGVPYYQRGSSIVRPVVETLQASRGRDTRMVQLFDVDVPYLINDLCKVATWLKLDGRSGKYSKVNAPQQVAVTLLAGYGDWKFPRITGVISTPTLRPDGSLLDKEGYDVATGLLLTGAPQMPPVSEYPTLDDARKALNTLKDLLLEFPFVNDADRSVALSTLITPVVRGAFPVAPMHVIRAPSPGSGKSFLLDIASAIAIGQPCPVMAAGRNEEETEKRLGAALMAGQPIINIDNVNGNLGGDFLCQLVERPIVEVRILGKSQMVKIESRSTIFATGNNIALLGDMTRRVMLCMLDANSERPELREFKSNPVHKVLAERGTYIAAILTLVRAYIVAGRPIKVPNIASFTEWSDLVRGSLIWLGEADPALSMETLRMEDPLLQNMANVFTSMYECLEEGKGYTAAEMLKVAAGEDGILGSSGMDKYEAFYETMLNATGTTAGRINSKHLGRWLGSHKGRIAAGLRLEGKVDRFGHATVWWVTPESDLT